MNANPIRDAIFTTLSLVMLLVAPGWAQSRPADSPGNRDADIVEEIKRLYRYRQDILVRRDLEALERFYPDDRIVTNPYNRVTTKAQIMELIRREVISYSSFERQFDHIRVYGDTVVVVGSETVVPAPDAKTPDAGKTIERRFTEVWVKRDGTWKAVVRHASRVTPP